ncbi:MAG TPA: hypothetical protein GX706_01025 [Candidatus Moranbacteria bacterium]|nr:hypothetical protein [Candidatus Moranbacteria bacterium]
MLTIEQLSELKEKLLTEKKSTETELEKIAEKRGGEDVRAKFELMDERDEEANADEVEEYASDLAVTEALEKKLKEINSALEKMETGTYGKCENCTGEKIPVERLRAYPAAATCIKCQN